MKNHCRIVFSMLALLVFIAQASTVYSAVITTDILESSPSENVLIRIGEDPNGSTSWRYTSATTATRHQDVGQTFYIDQASSIEAFVFRIATDSVAAVQGASFTLSIYEFASATSSTPVAEALYTASGVLPDSFLVDNYLSLALNTAFEAQAGKYYGVKLSFDSLLSGRSLNFFRQAKNTANYVDGTAFIYTNETEGSATQTYVTANYQFDLSVIGTAAVPEPRTSMLLGGVGSVLFLRRFWFGGRVIEK